MSHIVRVKTQIRDPIAVAAACQRLKLAAPEQKTVNLFSDTATGLAVQLPGWRYPVVCDLTTGEMQYDNFGGHWGEEAQRHRFLQAYAVELIKLQARKQGHTATEQQLADGSVHLQIVTA